MGPSPSDRLSMGMAAHARVCVAALRVPVAEEVWKCPPPEMRFPPPPHLTWPGLAWPRASCLPLIFSPPSPPAHLAVCCWSPTQTPSPQSHPHHTHSLPHTLPPQPRTLPAASNHRTHTFFAHTVSS